MHSLGVIEATPLPAAASSPAAEVVVATAPREAAAPDATGVHRASRAERLDDLHGRALLTGLSSASDATLRHAARLAGPVMRTVLDAPPDAGDVARWWSGLGREARHRLVTSAPQAVGNLEGVPYPVRDRANRRVLGEDLRSARAPDSGSASRLRMLEQVRTALVRGPEDPPKQLLTLDPRGSGRAAIAMGDLTTASDVTVMVPGMFFTVSGQFTDWTATGADLYREQATLTPLARGGRGGVAVVAWLGYRTPDLTNVLSVGLARAGAVRLERVVEGIDATRTADPVRVSVVAHSYGSTTALLALSSGRIHVDSLTVLGSPGSAVTRASELAVPAGQVFVGAAHWDPVAGTGYFGTDPAAPGFGSTVLDLRGGVDHREDEEVFRRPYGHNEYLVPGTASIHDVALIAVGRSDLVTGTDPSGRTVLTAEGAVAGTAADGSGSGGGGGGGGPESPDLLLVRPQDVQLRD
ncbi:alpha/beta hydrolase [Curtobacterium sp. MCBD17_040]|uniref:alpha/beta hydrolase n=1 Tax=Curtobacterium sp. MCBD17_040 TaxID=2175674 RepID=UPI0011B3A706|nr:alpha/beta hydrolase [Curtobacterium sp. MCBD17_040]WIB62821.1 alpha/beta hydrolase [Curtobacterium sp. MCBD17_040]